MDISKYKPHNDPVFMQLRDPINNELLADENGAVGLMVLGTDSDQYVAADKALTNKKLRGMNITRGNALNLNAEEIEQQSIALFAGCVTDIKNMEFEGKPLPYSKENVLKLMALPWLREQVVAFAQDRANFLKA